MPIFNVRRRSGSRPSICRCPIACQCQRISKRPQSKAPNDLLRHCQNASLSQARKPNFVLASRQRQCSGHEPQLSSSLTLIPSIDSSSCQTSRCHRCEFLYPTSHLPSFHRTFVPPLVTLPRTKKSAASK